MRLCARIDPVNWVIGDSHYYRRLLYWSGIINTQLCSCTGALQNTLEFQ